MSTWLASGEVPPCKVACSGKVAGDGEHNFVVIGTRMRKILPENIYRPYRDYSLMVCSKCGNELEVETGLMKDQYT